MANPRTPQRYNEEEDVVEYSPDYSLKEKIGMSISEILSNDAIKSSQNVIDNSKKDFLQWVENDLKTLEDAYKILSASPENGRDAALRIQKAAFSCKAQAGIFGYTLGSAVAKSLYDFLERDYVEGERGHVIVIRKHIDTLKTIFRRNVTGDGGQLGSAVYSALGKLIRKFEV